MNLAQKTCCAPSKNCHVTQLPPHIMATPPQRPLSFVFKVAFVERLNCILLGYK